jgi:uncharacterized coiled-coil protein SlyX
MGMLVNKSTAQLDFLMQVLQAITESDYDAQKVYPLLVANIDKLNERLAELLRTWAKNRLAEAKPDERVYIARSIFSFSNLIAEFPLG